MFKGKRALIIGVIILIIIGFYVFRGATSSTEPTSEKSAESMKVSSTVVSLAAVSNSGQTGTVTLSDVNGKIDVVANLSGVPAGSVEPIHIHLGSFAQLGGVKYPLSNVTNGVSRTTLEVSLNQILSELPLAINAHRSADELGVYVAWGDITSAMMEKEGAMEGQ